MLRCSYRQLLTSTVNPGVNRILNLRVNPKSFMMGVGFGSKCPRGGNAYKLDSALEEQAVVKELRAELLRGSAVIDKKAMSPEKYRYAEEELVWGSPVERHNVLSLEILSGISSQQVGGGGGNLASKFKRLLFVATQDQSTVLKKEISLLGCTEYTDDTTLLAGVKVLFRNVTPEQSLTFRLSGHPHTSTSSQGMQAAAGISQEAAL
jgi:hypothetical protein